VSDCPNCGKEVPPDAALCPNCGFDVHSGAADEVRRLREDGAIHPGRLGASDPADFAGGEPSEKARPADLPGDERGTAGPEDIDAGL
jgi:hypothetical protein